MMKRSSMTIVTPNRCTPENSSNEYDSDEDSSNESDTDCDSSSEDEGGLWWTSV